MAASALRRLREIAERALRRLLLRRGGDTRDSGAAGQVEPLEPRALMSAASAGFVIHISVDGLRPDAVTALGESALPNLHRLRTGGAYTDNARTDYDFTVTLPNHVGQVTGRPVFGCGPDDVEGHRWTTNGDAPAGRTLHRNAGGYVASVWDVAHDNGLRTALFASKSKFSLFHHSYDADPAPQGGAADTTGADDGRDKIDSYLYGGSAVITDTLVAEMSADPFHYAMVHYRDPDEAGHGDGWMGGAYRDAVRHVDAQVGKILRMIDTTPALAGRTAVILTADHGGAGTDHSAAGEARNYTIPFYVWGPGVPAGAELYALNPATRLNPGAAAPDYGGVQPIRNGDVANLALDFLDLPPVPHSFFNADQSLAVTPDGVFAPPVTPACDHHRRRIHPAPRRAAQALPFHAVPMTSAWIYFFYGSRLLQHAQDGTIVGNTVGEAFDNLGRKRRT